MDQLSTFQAYTQFKREFYRFIAYIVQIQFLAPHFLIFRMLMDFMIRSEISKSYREHAVFMNDLQSNFSQLKSKMFYFNVKEKLSVIGYLGFNPTNILWKVSIGSPLLPPPFPSPQFLIIFPNKVVIAKVMQQSKCKPFSLLENSDLNKLHEDLIYEKNVINWKQLLLFSSSKKVFTVFQLTNYTRPFSRAVRSYFKFQVPSPTAGEDRARARSSSTDGHTDGCVCMEVGGQRFHRHRAFIPWKYKAHWKTRPS